MKIFKEELSLKKLSKVINNPSVVWSKLRRITSGILAKKYFVAAAENRSDSENGLYLSSVLKATNSYIGFSNFKKDPLYKEILEHVTYDQGARYAFLIRRDNPQLLGLLDLFKKNDQIGNPDLLIFHFLDDAH